MKIKNGVAGKFRNLVSDAKRKFDIKDRIQKFAGPIKDGLASLRGKLPNAKAFAGSEDVGEQDPAEKKPGLIARLKNFKKSLNEMSDFQKMILLVIAICLPAGILIATLLVKYLKGRKKK